MSGLDDDDDFLNDIYAEDKPKVEPKVESPAPSVPTPAPTAPQATADPRVAPSAPSASAPAPAPAPSVAPVPSAPSGPSTSLPVPSAADIAAVAAALPAATGPNGDLVYRSDGNAALGNIVIPPKDEGKMFIGGLNWETTDESLTNYFAQFGEVLECTVMRDHFSGKSRGFGFLTFRDPKCVNAVMAKEHYLDGKIIDPKRAIPREEQDKTSKIFVGGVGSDVTEEDYKQFFEQYGTVIDAQLMIDKDSGRPRGFGFVTFDSEQAMNTILAQPLLILKDKPIEVKRAENRSKGAGASAVANAVAGGGQSYNNNSYGSNNSSGNHGNSSSAPSEPQNSYGGMTPQAMTQWWQQYMQYMQQVQQMQGGAAADPEAQQAMMAQMMAQMQQQQGGQQGNHGNHSRDHRDHHSRDHRDARDDDSSDDNEMRRVDRGRDDRSGRRGRGYNQSDRRSRSPGVPTGPRDGRQRGRRHGGGGRGRDRRDGGRAPGYHPYGGSRDRRA